MEFLRLNPETYEPDALIEDYSSLIWTERKTENGEFEMKTSDVEVTRNLLPEDALVTHLDTREVMIVESHSITPSDETHAELTLKGRTFGTFLENRSLLSMVYGEEWQSLRQYTASEMVALIIWAQLVNDSGADPLRAGAPYSTLTKVLGVSVTDSTTLTEAAETWTLSSGEAYPKVIDFLTLKDLGLRSIRPGGTSGLVVSSDATGNLLKTNTSDISGLRLDIYHGLDRTRNQDFLDPVIFSAAAGDIDDPSYVFSKKRLKNVALVTSSLQTFEVWENNVPIPEPTGRDRRVLFVDGGSQETDQPNDEFIAAITQKARIELKKNNREVLFDGGISVTSPYKYNQDYYLGDKITLSAEYGFEETMEIVEYVRTEDQSGDRGYPTLVLAE